MITVFYDGKCGLCRREINSYIRIAPPKVFNWVDITKDPDPFTALGFSLSDGLSSLHAQDQRGIMHKGVKSFLLIWENIPSFRWLAAVIGHPLVCPFAGWGYRLFAGLRFKIMGYDRCGL